MFSLALALVLSSAPGLELEGLHAAMSNAVNSGLIRGIKLGSFDITLSHLFNADKGCNQAKLLSSNSSSSLSLTQSSRAFIELEPKPVRFLDSRSREVGDDENK
ncbi:hypothetical protein Tco_1178767 [Tanacetum coccineum]